MLWVNQCDSESDGCSSLDKCAKKNEEVVWGRENFGAMRSVAQRGGGRELNGLSQKGQHTCTSQKRVVSVEMVKGDSCMESRCVFSWAVLIDMLAQQNSLGSWALKTDEASDRGRSGSM